MHAALQQEGGCAVITGASSGGIGFSIAQILLTRYKKRVVLADVNPISSDLLVKAGIPEDQYLLHQCDVTDYGQVQQLAAKAYEWGQRIDFLVLNAGVSVPTKDYGGDIQDWHKILNVNFFGVLNGTQAFIDQMVSRCRTDAYKNSDEAGQLISIRLFPGFRSNKIPLQLL
jgi:NAD(P)-dependent dehydrogenase (short-subunit alcohol dehydrogenase family)